MHSKMRGRRRALLDLHADPDHNRTRLHAGRRAGHAAPRAASHGAREAVERDRPHAPHAGVHPRVGALDVAPVVYLDDDDRGAACAEALVAADELGARARAPGVPLRRAGRRAHPRRAAPRRPGTARAAHRRRRAAPRLRPAARCTRPPAPRSSPPARRWSRSTSSSTRRRRSTRPARSPRAIRESGAEGCRACARSASSSSAAASCRSRRTSRTTAHDRLADVVAAVRAHAPVTGAELVGLAPRAALEASPPTCRSTEPAHVSRTRSQPLHV